jgi:hypothetical protein
MKEVDNNDEILEALVANGFPYVRALLSGLRGRDHVGVAFGRLFQSGCHDHRDVIHIGTNIV